MNRSSIAFVVALLALSTALGWVALRSRGPLETEARVAYRPIQITGDGYVSSDRCQACHPAQYKTWHDSYHRSMTQIASPETVIADFGRVTVPEVNGGSPMVLERRGSQFWAEFDDPDWIGAGSRPRIARQVVMLTGSHNQQAYWYRTGNSRILGQLPAMYLIKERQWIPRSAAFLISTDGSWPSETGRWSRVCINCHATHGKAQVNPPGPFPFTTQTADSKVAEFGIGCEACHGPSEQHATMNRGPWRRYSLHLTGRPDPTIVQPQRVSPRLSSEVCGQCHSVWEYYDEAGQAAANEAGLPYRPGEELRKTRFIAHPAADVPSPEKQRPPLNARSSGGDAFWTDGMIRVSGREYNGLIDSPCFKNAHDDKRTLSCFSCHTMHKTDEDPRAVKEWADSHQVSVAMEGNEACLQCHATFRTNLPAHTKHQEGSSGSSCYNCHMPYTTYGLLRAQRSHQISSPSVSVSVQTGRPNACNSCHMDKTLGWTSEYLQKWSGAPKAPLDQEQQTVAASLLWLLKGDAGQRALVAWSMGWQPAQRISGTDWMAPYLSILLNDPYAAVRLVAYRSLRAQPGFGNFQYNFAAPFAARVEDRTRAVDVWRAMRGPGRANAALLLDADGWPDVEVVNMMWGQRDDRAISLPE